MLPIQTLEAVVLKPVTSGALTVIVLKLDTGLPQPLLIVYVILAVPALTAFTTPVEGSTVATAVFVLLQLPPEVALRVKVGVAPIQTGEVPLTVPAITLLLTFTV